MLRFARILHISAINPARLSLIARVPGLARLGLDRQDSICFIFQ